MLFCTWKRSPFKLLDIRIYKQGSHDSRCEKLWMAIGGMTRSGRKTFLWAVFWRWGPIGREDRPEGFLLQGIGAGETMARILASGNSIMRKKSMKMTFLACFGRSADEMKNVYTVIGHFRGSSGVWSKVVENIFVWSVLQVSRAHRKGGPDGKDSCFRE